MVRVLLGNEHVGVQGIYYFADREKAHEFGEDNTAFLRSARSGTEDYKEILYKYSGNEALFNFFIKVKEKVDEEDAHPEVWWEPGGDLYGPKWENPDLPNGRGITFSGKYSGEMRLLDDEDFDAVYV